MSGKMQIIRGSIVSFMLILATAASLWRTRKNSSNNDSQTLQWFVVFANFAVFHDSIMENGLFTARRNAIILKMISFVTLIINSWALSRTLE